MSISFQAKGDAQLAQQLKVQELNLVVTAAQANTAFISDLSLITLSGAPATRALSIKIGEAVAQVIVVTVRNQSTGAIVALTVAPSASGTSILTQIDASTATAPLAICVKYVVVE